MTEEDIISLFTIIRDLQERVEQIEKFQGETTNIEVVDTIGDVPAESRFEGQLVVVRNDGLYRYDAGLSDYVKEA